MARPKSNDQSIEKRLAIIKEIITKNPDCSQNQIRLKLKTSYDIDVDQSTVGRDLKALRYERKGKSGPYVKMPEAAIQNKDKKLKALAETLNNSSASLHPNVHIFAMTTEAGLARNIALKMEDVFSDSIVGTVSDEKSLIVIAKSKAQASVIFANLNRYLDNDKKIKLIKPIKPLHIVHVDKIKEGHETP